MNRLLSLIGSLLLLTCAPLAKAYLVEDVITFNRSLQTNEPLAWVHDLTQYGYVPQTPYTGFSLTLELRDLQDAPGKDVLDRPFFMLTQGQGRSFGRVLMEDLVLGGVIHIDANGMVRPSLTILEGEVWIGRAIARVELPDTIPVPEPGIIWLLALGLLPLCLRRSLGVMSASKSTHSQLEPKHGRRRGLRAG